MTHRFGRRTPAWLRRLLLGGFILAYVLVLALGTIGITWPSAGLATWQWVLARVSGTAAALSGLVCLASFPAKRWQWEMLALPVAGAALAGYVLIISTAGRFSTQLLVLTLAMLVIVGLYIRTMDLVARAHRWADQRRAGRAYDQRHGR